ncbi:MAG: TetR/AcrR family transcriptional regulator, partial [Nocardioidaceae bacterium]
EMIAEQAGLTRRTFFRHFSDKRDVIFAGSEQLPPAVGQAIADAAPGASPGQVVVAALVEVAGRLQDILRPSVLRHGVIMASPELREREHTKYEAVAEAIAVGLQGRGVAASASVLLGRAGSTVFRTAFERWAEEPSTRPLASQVRAVATELRALWD